MAPGQRVDHPRRLSPTLRFSQRRTLVWLNRCNLCRILSASDIDVAKNAGTALNTVFVDHILSR